MNHEDEKKNIEHFEVSPTIKIIFIGIGISLLFIVVFAVWFLKNRSSTAIKYLTSSTSPGFDLTFTPNM